MATASDAYDDDARPSRTADDRPAPRAPERRGFFDIYKPTQGYYTRMGTGIAAGVMGLWAAAFAYGKLSLLGADPRAQAIQVAVAVVLFLASGLTAYWAVALNRRVCDFLIATEGEMKKVNWTSRTEIIGSTKVVIFTVFFLATFLFVIDLLLMVFFTEIGVLRIAPELLTRLFGSEAA